MAKHDKRRGFTLIELLIVAGIITVAVVLVVPMLSNYQARVELTACQMHLATIHRIFSAYAEESRGWYPLCGLNQGFKFASYGTPADPADPFKTLRQVVLLKQLGARAEYFFCPMDPAFRNDGHGSDGVFWQSWDRPYKAGAHDDGAGPSVRVGYEMLQYRGCWWDGGKFVLANKALADGRRVPISNAQEDDNLPLVADRLHSRNSGDMTGWFHGRGEGGSGVFGFFNSSCNTLFTNGRVEYRPWSDLEAQGPALVHGPDFYWFWLGKEVGERAAAK